MKDYLEHRNEWITALAAWWDNSPCDGCEVDPCDNPEGCEKFQAWMEKRPEV